MWKGIPYAQPPTGDLRWKEPQPVAAWQGVRHAREFGPVCPQGSPAQLKPDMSEDCLNLNVWSGAKAGENRLAGAERAQLCVFAACQARRSMVKTDESFK